MSAQSINLINIKDTCEKIDNYLIGEGNYFRNIIDFDINSKIDYNKLDLILYLKQMMDRNKNCQEILRIINKKLIT